MNEETRPSKQLPIRWGMIGCGMVTEKKSAPAYQQVAGFELAGVYSRRSEQARDYAQRHQVAKVYETAAQLLDDPDIDAVYIATPPDSHQQFALEVVKRNKPCCIEKPLAPDYPTAKVIVDAFKQANVPLFVAYYRRSLPRFRQIKTWLEHHAIGQVRHISWELTKPPNEFDLSGAGIWRTDKAIAYGGYFDDVGCHGLDLFNYLLGNIEMAKGFAVNQQGYYDAMDAITGTWLHPNQVTGCGVWNFAAEARRDNVKIFGSEGSIEFSVFQELPVKLARMDTTGAAAIEELFIENPDPIQLHHVQNLCDFFSQDIPHPCPGEAGLHANWVMDQLLRGE